MEDTFKLRVDKVFGSLSSSSSTTPSISSLWSLTDDEIEKREWDRNTDSPKSESTPYPSNLDGFFANEREQEQNRRKTVSDSSCLGFSSEIEEDLEDLVEEVDEDGDVSDLSKQPAKPDDHDDEEWEIRSSIGLDCTLDYEDEEDEFDKLAVGREKVGDRVYMSGLNDYAAFSNSYKELPISFSKVERDSRANHLAAKLKLEQDEKTPENHGSITDSQGKTAADANLKSILKRKNNKSDSKSEKRVRFDPECKFKLIEDPENEDEFEKQTCIMEEAPISNQLSLIPQDRPGIPDYLRNPSKYTCYTFDSSNEADEEVNRTAYMDFLNLVRKPNTMDPQTEDASFDLPKSVTFTPRKRTEDGTNVKKNSKDGNGNDEASGKRLAQKKGFPLSIVGDEVEGSEVCDMDEDEPETVVENSVGPQRKSGRQYRSKAESEFDE